MPVTNKGVVILVVTGILGGVDPSNVLMYGDDIMVMYDDVNSRGSASLSRIRSHVAGWKDIIEFKWLFTKEMWISHQMCERVRKYDKNVRINKWYD